MSTIVRVGLDLAKHVFQVHGVDAKGAMVTNRPLHRGKLVEWCAQLPVGCIVAMEASSGAHHWCRKLQALGLDARIISAQLVAPYRMQGKTGKNDANDAAAICEAASRPQMCFVPPKTIAQQGMLCVQRLRERSGWQIAAVALANKNARILWAVMSKGRDFDPHHVSVRPGSPAMAT